MLLDTCSASDSAHSAGWTGLRSCSSTRKPSTTKPSVSWRGWSGKVVCGVMAPVSRPAAAVTIFMIEPGV